MARFDDSDDELDEAEYAGFDTSDPDDDVTQPCPHCGTAIYDDAEQCHACGQYLSQEDATRKPLPAWIIVGLVICLVIAISWALFG
jgi:predicted nucleic acid-binding Zn ribbon protein